MEIKSVQTGLSCGHRSCHPFLSGTLFLLLIGLVYFLWAIQPLSFDDWKDDPSYYTFTIPSPPASGVNVRAEYGHHMLLTNPFSLWRPATFLTTLLFGISMWFAFGREKIWVRFGLAFLTMLGFPYLGHIGPWNLVSAEYTPSILWMILWYAVFCRSGRTTANPWINRPLLFILTFLGTVWHQVTLMIYTLICGYLVLEIIVAKFWGRRSSPDFSQWINVAFILTGYGLAVFYYTRGGAEHVVSGYMKNGGVRDFLTFSHIVDGIKVGTKTSLVLIKDFLPVAFLILYLKLKKNQVNILETNYRLFGAATLGAFAFLYVCSFLVGDPQWRARCICMFVLSAFFYSLPNSLFIDPALRIFRFGNKTAILRGIFLFLSIGWLTYNAYFTYYYNNINVAGWHQYRKMVLARDPSVLEEINCQPLPAGRPRGTAPLRLDHIWGIQDDRYRIFLPPAIQRIVPAIKDYWAKHPKY